MADRWVDEFRNEIASDHRQILERRERSDGGSWSFAAALDSTRRFYRERLTGYARCGSISEQELAELLLLVEAMGTEHFPAGGRP